MGEGVVGATLLSALKAQAVHINCHTPLQKIFGGLELHCDSTDPLANSAKHVLNPLRCDLRGTCNQGFVLSPGGPTMMFFVTLPGGVQSAAAAPRSIIFKTLGGCLESITVLGVAAHAEYFLTSVARFLLG